jgi:hypothetical protein
MLSGKMHLLMVSTARHCVALNLVPV